VKNLYRAVAILMLVAACGQPAASAPSPSPSVSAVPPVSSPVPMPPPAEHPNYPPQNLPDLIALADQGVDRRFIGMEGQSLGPACNRAWMRVNEPPGVPPRQEAADLLKVSIDRFAFQKSCGAFIFGTTDLRVCNCYHAENGYLEIDRGPNAEPEPGKMLVLFALNDKDSSPQDWQLTVDAPTG
jgi:hypothetical protein